MVRTCPSKYGAFQGFGVPQQKMVSKKKQLNRMIGKSFDLWKQINVFFGQRPDNLSDHLSRSVSLVGQILQRLLSSSRSQLWFAMTPSTGIVVWCSPKNCVTSNVVLIINHPIFDRLYHQFMVHCSIFYDFSGHYEVHPKKNLGYEWSRVSPLTGHIEAICCHANNIKWLPVLNYI